MNELTVLVAARDDTVAGFVDLAMPSELRFVLRWIPEDRDELFARLEQSWPDLVFLELGFMCTDGNLALPRLYQCARDHPLGLVGMYHAPAAASTAIRYGVRHLLRLPCPLTQIRDALYLGLESAHSVGSYSELLWEILCKLGMEPGSPGTRLMLNCLRTAAESPEPPRAAELYRQVAERWGGSPGRISLRLGEAVRGAALISAPLYIRLFGGNRERSFTGYDFMIRVLEYVRQEYRFL